MTSVIIIGSNRELYFEKTLKSIVPQLNGRKLYILLDMPTSKGKRHQDQHKSIVKRVAGNDCEIICQPSHVGLGINMIQARDIALENHERAFIVEDDLIVSEDYLDYTEKMMDYGESNYDNIAICQGWSETWEEEPDDEYTVRDSGAHFWGYLQNKWSWDIMKKDLYEYRDKFLLGIKYSDKDSLGIIKWKVDKVKDATPTSYEREFDIHPKSKLSSITKGAGQDSINIMSMYINNLARLSPCRSKAKYIGVNGQNYNIRVWKALKMDERKYNLKKTEGEFRNISGD